MSIKFLIPFLLVAVQAVFASTPAKEPSALARFNQVAFATLFFDVSFGLIELDEVDRSGQPVLTAEGSGKQRTVKIPLIIAILFGGAVFFSLFYRFINIRGFRHALDIVRGKYDNPDDKGDVSHFRALTSALSATVGLGNIAGVAIAISLGGPGAAFWMAAAAVFGMASKFSCCTLSQMYRKTNLNGTVSGGPMYYLDMGMRNMGPLMSRFGKFLALIYGVAILFAAIGGGNMFQVNQTVEAFKNTFQLGAGADWAIGILFAIFTAAVVLGGIKRIGLATSRLIPFMVALYVLGCLAVLAVHLEALPSAIVQIFSMAFSGNAFHGGIIGVMVVGIQRAAFSNEAGLGSASIAHAAARTNEPVREGLVGLLEPFVDTIVVCMMTALMVVVTGVWNRPDLIGGSQLGVTLTTEAFKTVFPWFPYVLAICIGLFAYSTAISWCYYGERGWIYLLDHFGEHVGHATLWIFRVIFVLGILVGATHSLTDVLDFSDVCILSIAFPNIIGMIILAPQVWRQVDDYWKRYKAGAFTSIESE